MAPFLGWGSTASRLEPLREGSLAQFRQFRQFTITIGHLVVNV